MLKLSASKEKYLCHQSLLIRQTQLLLAQSCWKERWPSVRFVWRKFTGKQFENLKQFLLKDLRWNSRKMFFGLYYLKDLKKHVFFL